MITVGIKYQQVIAGYDDGRLARAGRAVIGLTTFFVCVGEVAVYLAFYGTGYPRHVLVRNF